jgi:formate-dependent nitrite reductase membrane component NrfD
LGIICGFFIASYTGVLLTATNQPVWSDTPWIGALFLASSAGTGLAAIELMSWLTGPWHGLTRSPEPNDSATAGGKAPARLQSSSIFHALEPWIWILELACAGFLLHTLGVATLKNLVSQRLAAVSFAGAIGLAIVIPALLRWGPKRLQTLRRVASALSVLIGGFLLRYAVLTAPGAIRIGIALLYPLAER